MSVTLHYISYRLGGNNMHHFHCTFKAIWSFPPTLFGSMQEADKMFSEAIFYIFTYQIHGYTYIWWVANLWWVLCNTWWIRNPTPTFFFIPFAVLLCLVPLDCILKLMFNWKVWATKSHSHKKKKHTAVTTFSLGGHILCQSAYDLGDLMHICSPQLCCRI